MLFSSLFFLYKKLFFYLQPVEQTKSYIFFFLVLVTYWFTIYGVKSQNIWLAQWLKMQIVSSIQRKPAIRLSKKTTWKYIIFNFTQNCKTKCWLKNYFKSHVYKNVWHIFDFVHKNNVEKAKNNNFAAKSSNLLRYCLSILLTFRIYFVNSVNFLNFS